MSNKKPSNDEQAKTAKNRQSDSGVLSRQTSSVLSRQTSSVLSRQPSSTLSRQPSAILQRSESEGTESEAGTNEAYPQLQTRGRNFAQFVGHAGGPPRIQPKLMVGPAGDKYEQEADRVARQVIRGLAKPASAVQQSPVLDGDKVQAKPNHGLEGGEVDADVARAIGSAKGGGSPIDDNVRSSMEQGFGADFRSVRVHTGGQADALNRSLNARAFTTGSDIFFGKGQYNPGSSGGKELLAHELTHTVQQGAVSVQRSSDAHQSGCSCAGCKTQIQRHAVEELQRKPHYDGHQSSCGCATCKTGIQRHTTEDLQRNFIQRKPADHTTGCGCAACGSVQRQAAERVQRSISDAPAKAIRPSIAGSGAPLVQRHSSWEHKALGDIAPEDLAVLGGARDIQGDKATIKMSNDRGEQAELEIPKADIIHVIEQEIRRLNHFKKMDQIAAGAQSSTDVENALKDSEMQAIHNETISGGGTYAQAVAAVATSPEWGVKIIQLDLKDGKKEFITYGEMNTLADIYGSVDEMQKTDPDNLHGIILGIRQQSLYRFMELYEEVSGTMKYQQQAEAKRGKRSFLGKVGSGLKKGLAGGLGMVGGAIAGGVGSIVGGAGVGAKAAYLKGGGGVKGAMLGALGGLGGLAAGTVASPVAAVAGAGAGAYLGGSGGKLPKSLGGGRLGSLEGSDKFSGLGFEGAIGNTGVGGKEGNTVGELRFMGMIPGQKGKSQIAGDKTTDYSAGLARNACHFPPDSWNAWQRYHDQALVKATLASQELDETAKAKMVNDALILNGFGDHFLQDSYASGHLIDKTKIMKMYVKWIDDTGTMNYSTNADWRRVQNMAYGQKDFAGGDSRYTDTAARDPQMVENQGGDMAQKHDQLGLATATLQNAGAIALLKWWAADVNKRWRISNPREKSIKTLMTDKKSPLKGNKPGLEAALKELRQKGIVRPGKHKASNRGADTIQAWSSDTVILREDYVPKTQDHKTKLATTGDIEDMSRQANLKDYEAFMNNAFLQKSTNALHDYYCEKGLDVVTGDGFSFRIYGDDAMLQKNSSAGVKHSGETTRMSRAAIETAAATGQPAHSTAEIKNRFPKRIVSGDTSVTLDQWHNDGILKSVCETTVFPGMRKGVMNSLMQVHGMGLKGGLGDLHKPHGGNEVF